MSRMRRIPRLERIHRIRTLLLKFVHNLGGSLAPLVQPVIVPNTIEELHLAADEVVAPLVHLFDVGMAGVDDAEHAGDDFLLAVGVDFGVAEDGDDVSHLGGQCHGVLGGVFDGRLGVLGTTEGDGNAHGNAIGGTELFERLEVGGARLYILILRQIEGIDQDGIEMQYLQQGSLPHESLEGGGPPLANDLEPVQVQIGDQYLGQSLRLQFFGSLQMLRHVQIDHLIAIRIWQPRRSQFGRPLQYPIHLQPPKQNIRRLFNRQLVRSQHNLRLGRRLIRIINTRKMFQLPALHPRILSLGIPLLQLLHGHIQKDFIKRNPLILVSLPHGIAIATIRRDQPHQSDNPRIREQCGNLPRAPYALGTIGLAKRQIPIDPRP
mmetsp:Transcript_30218/g.54722  ORF Transcript_30218/g.54722 Transcript_30218/m.54722 type:complete len:378 (-) Transcript_30218:743-1876(-)